MSETESWQEEDWQEARSDTADIMEDLFGPVHGHFTLNQAATTGDHPEQVRAAWVGIAVPVRETLVRESVSCKSVSILCTDAFNALVEAEVSESVLQYWIDMLNGKAGPEATFIFDLADGTYSPVE